MSKVVQREASNVLEKLSGYKDWFQEQEDLVDFLIDLELDTTSQVKVIELAKDSFIYPFGFVLDTDEEGKQLVENKLSKYNLVFDSYTESYEGSDIFSYTCFNVRKRNAK